MMSADQVACIQQAESDPNGLMHALYQIGVILDFPGGHLGPVVFEASPGAWIETLVKTPTRWLALAWYAAEQGDVPHYGPRNLVSGVNSSAANSRAQEIQTRARGQRKYNYQAPGPDGQSATEGDMQVPVIQPSMGIEPGVYQVKITDIREQDSTFRDPATGKDKLSHQLVFELTVLDEKGALTDETIRAYATQAWGPRAKLYQWASEILGRKCPSATEPFNSDALLNMRCDIQVELKPNGYAGVTKVRGFRTISLQDQDDETPMEQAFAVK